MHSVRLRDGTQLHNLILKSMKILLNTIKFFRVHLLVIALFLIVNLLLYSEEEFNSYKLTYQIICWFLLAICNFILNYCFKELNNAKT